MEKQRKFSIEEVRSFLGSANRQFERGGIYLNGVRFKRDNEGRLTGIICSYEEKVTETK